MSSTGYKGDWTGSVTFLVFKVCSHSPGTFIESLDDHHDSLRSWIFPQTPELDTVVQWVELNFAPGFPAICE